MCHDPLHTVSAPANSTRAEGAYRIPEENIAPAGHIAPQAYHARKAKRAIYRALRDAIYLLRKCDISASQTRYTAGAVCYIASTAQTVRSDRRHSLSAPANSTRAKAHIAFRRNISRPQGISCRRHIAPEGHIRLNRTSLFLPRSRTGPGTLRDPRACGSG